MKRSGTAPVILCMVFFAAIFVLVFNVGGPAPEFLQPQSSSPQYTYLLSAGFATGLIATVGLLKALKKRGEPDAGPEIIATTIANEEPIA